MQSACNELNQWKLLENFVPEICFETIKKILKKDIASQRKWAEIMPMITQYEMPFDIIKDLFHFIYPDKNEAYAYLPKPNLLKKSYLMSWMERLNLNSVKDFHQFSLTEKNLFWGEIIQKMPIYFKKPYSKLMDIIDSKNPKWLVDSAFNIVDTCLNHNKDKKAIIYLDHIGEIQSITYGELNQLVDVIAYSLIDKGFKKGDRIAIDMTMTKEAVAIYLGIIKAGLSVVSIADSFSSDEIKIRLEITNAKAIFTEDYIYREKKKIPLYERVKNTNPNKIIVLKNTDQSDIQLRNGDLSFDDFLVDINKIKAFESISCQAEDEINVLFSSGTTGQPKAISWSHSTAVKVYSDSLLHFDASKSDIWAWPTNLGWMMGPWVTLTALMHGSTLALYYDAPTTKGFAEFIEKVAVTKLGIVPSIVSALRLKGVLDSDINWQKIEVFGSTGECSNFDDMLYLSSKANFAPVIEYCGGTEIGGAYITATTIEPLIPSTFTTPAFGLDLCLLNEQLTPFEDEGEGEAALIGPSFGLSKHLLNKNHDDIYYKGMPVFNGNPLRRHGDEILRIKNKEGYFYKAQGRADDTMNLGGIKISSAEIERCVNQLAFIYESAAIAINGDGGPSKLVIFVVLNELFDKEILKLKIQDKINKNLNPLFKVSDVVIINALPRTASNKVMRRVLRENYKTS